MRPRAQLLLALPAAALLAVFFALPVAAVALDALSEGTRAFARVFALSPFWRSLGGRVASERAAAGTGDATAAALPRRPAYAIAA